MGNTKKASCTSLHKLQTRRPLTPKPTHRTSTHSSPRLSPRLASRPPHANAHLTPKHVLFCLLGSTRSSSSSPLGNALSFRLSIGLKSPSRHSKKAHPSSPLKWSMDQQPAFPLSYSDGDRSPNEIKTASAFITKPHNQLSEPFSSESF